MMKIRPNLGCFQQLTSLEISRLGIRPTDLKYHRVAKSKPGYYILLKSTFSQKVTVKTSNFPFLSSLKILVNICNLINARSKGYSPELQKCYFLYNDKQICSKVPISEYFVGPKSPSGNCYISCFFTEKTPLRQI